MIAILLLCNYNSYSQQLVYADVVYGGVTGNGGSVANGSGTINFPIQIPPNSTIKKAFLIAARDSLADDITVTLNGTSYTYSNSTIITSGFNSLVNFSINRPNSSMHIIDITLNIDSSILNYSLFIPPQSNSYKGAYTFFYLYIVYENLALPKITCNLFLNTQNVAPITIYNLSDLTPINNLNTVGLAVNTLQFCDTVEDGSYVAVNGTTIGLIGGDDLNSNLWTCVGPWANFAHYNDSLFGLDDDTPDSLMAGTDALADIKSYVNNGDTAVNVTFTYQSNFEPLTNPIRAVMLSYSTPCDTFSTTATTNTDTVCAGENVQLNATGGASYSWFSAFSTFNDSTLANPVAMPSQTTTYIVTIKNALGCVKTEHVKVWVNPTPKPDTITTTPQRCGSANGSITVGNIPNGTPPFTYQLTNLQNTTTTTQSTNTFTNLSTGYYQLSTSDSKGCQWQSDTLFVPVVNDITANFGVYTIPWSFPFSTNPIGVAPLTVYTQNSSVNANLYEWTISGQSSVGSSQDIIAQYTSFNTQHSFEDGGTFEICLLAYNNIPVCGDTACKTISITPNSGVDSLVFVVPNVFSPNHDGNNDNFVLQVQGVNLLEKIEVEIFNRWGMLVQGLKFDVESLNGQIASSLAMTELVLWDGTTTSGTQVPEGTYFYVVSYTKLSGESESLKGSITLLR